MPLRRAAIQSERQIHVVFRLSLPWVHLHNGVAASRTTAESPMLSSTRRLVPTPLRAACKSTFRPVIKYISLSRKRVHQYNNEDEWSWTGTPDA